MRKVKHKLAIYGKMYGNTLPTAEKMENAGAVADMVTVAYNTGVIDAKEKKNDCYYLYNNRMCNGVFMCCCYRRI